MADELALINNWLQDLLAERGENMAVSDLQEAFVEQQLAQFKSQLGVQAFSLVTVRSSFRRGSAYLRPVYSWPLKLGEFMSQPERQRPFSFGGGRKVAFPDSIYVSRPTADSKLFVAIYEVTGRLDKVREDMEFGARIESFWGSLHQANAPELRGIPAAPIAEGHKRYCFFGGREKEDHRAALELDHIFAAYFDSDKGIDKLALTLADQLSACEALFHGLEIISTSDASLFRSEGRQLVADLLPEFSRKEVAPADKVAFAIEKLKRLLARHLLGRYGTNRQPIVHYVATSFEPNGDGTHYRPHFRIYPHVYRRPDDSVRGAFLIGHRHVPSAAKFLLRRYFSKSPALIVETSSYRARDDKDSMPKIELHRDFEDIFSSNASLTINDKLAAVIFPDNSADQLHLLSKDFGRHIPQPDMASLFDQLNQQVRSGIQVNSIVAFVIEGAIIDRRHNGGQEQIVRQLPRGILAIESAVSFAFSDDDVKSLREIAVGFASLMRQISHDNSGLDYRAQIKKALSKQSDVGDSASVMLSVLKMDGTLFNALIVNDELIEQVVEHYRQACIGLSDRATNQIRTALESLGALIGRSDDDSIEDEEMASRTIKRRRLKARDIRDIVLTLTEDSAKDFIENFLDAVPENFTWSSYLSAMAEALGDRVTKSLPEFTAIAAGYSASNVFIAAKAQELRQVVKLSGLANLQNERKNYIDYVRYRLPLAARIPVNAFAFDSIGEFGQSSGSDGKTDIGVGDLERYNQRAYGALVSDLVSAQVSDPSISAAEEGNIRTLMSVTADLVAQSAGELRKTTIEGAIAEHFSDRSLSLWTVTTRESMGYRSDVIASHRIKMDPRSTHFSPIVVKAFCNAEDAVGKIDSVYRGYYRPHLDGEARDYIGASSIGGIIHGDLNARNLSWSDALQRFVLIDFEHVMPGIQLCDQTRLAINIACDIYSNSLSLPHFQSQTTLDTLVDNVIDAIGELGEVSEFVWAPEPMNEECLASILKHVRSSGTIVASMLRTILSTFDKKSPFGDGGLRQIWREFQGYALFGAALKEYQYSCNSLRADMDNQGATYQYDEGVGEALVSIVKCGLSEEKGAHNRLRAMLKEISRKTLLENTDKEKLPTIRAGELARHLTSLCILLTFTPHVGLIRQPTIRSKTSPGES